MIKEYSQLADSVETYAYGMSKDLVLRIQVIRYNKTIQKMINYDYVTKENIN